MAEEKKLKITETADKKSDQPTYDQLKDWCNQLMIQRNQLGQKLSQVTNAINTLPWLFEVLKSKEFFDEKFVQDCASEIKYIISPPEERKNDNKE